MQNILEGETGGLHWHKSVFELGSKGNFRVWAGFGLVQLMTFGSYVQGFGLSLAVHFQQKVTLCDPFILYS